MCESIFLCFEKYQTFVAGVLGFGGVIFTIFMNARLLMQQHDRQIEHERMAIRTTICSELEVIRRIFADRSKKDNETGGIKSAFFPENISTNIYSKFVNKIYLLSDHEIESVIQAYALVNELPNRLKLLSSRYDASFDRPGYIFIDSEHAETAIGIHKSFLPKIEEALQILNDFKGLSRGRCVARGRSRRLAGRGGRP